MIKQALEVLEKLTPTYNLDILKNHPDKKIHIHGAGKSAPRMAQELLDLGVQAKPVIVGLHSGHPIPDYNSIKGAELLIKEAKKLGEKDLVLFCLSGGASSLIELPIEQIDFEELQRIFGDLLLSGKNIHQINMERKKLSQIKDGRLGDIYSPAHVHCFIESDVEGDVATDVGSSPILGDQNSHSFEIVLSKGHLRNTMGVMFPKYHCVEINEVLEDNIKAHLKLLETHRLLASCGETTVIVKVDGKGGRNTHWAACMGLELLKQGKDFELLSIGTDGKDGATDAAGAFLDSRVPLKELRQAIKAFDTYTLFEKYDLLIKTGPTGVNLNDLRLIKI